MSKRQIYRILDKDEFFNTKTGVAVPFIKYHDPTWKEAGQILRRDGGDATLEELVQLCDQDAENRNAHEFVGAHRLLGRVLYTQYGRGAATKTMLEIAELGGLHGMNGVGNDDEADAYKYLKVGRNGFDWNGNYGR